MKTLFLSDLHLEDSRPEALHWIIGVVEGSAGDAPAVYIVGDLLEYWMGDDRPSQTARTLAGATRDLADRGVPIGFIHGNRDFLLGAAYAAQAGFDLLPETVTLDLYGTPTVLLHGDTLCTDDLEYQAVRAQTRDPSWQRQVLSMSVQERIDMARNARDASMAHTGSTAADIMDVNQQAVLDVFAPSGARLMIHGHTHRPAVHPFHVDERPVHRIVLGDWYEQGSMVEWDEDGPRLEELAR
mgnify:CR=1 FL=1